MKERIVMFGADNHMLGLLTEPAVPPAPGQPAVLFLNAGIIHHIGPHRMNVKLARHAASLGYAAFRFDLSGLGESAATRGPLAFREQAVADIAAAIDTIVERTGCSRVLGVGLCSGADNLYCAAITETRLCGLMLLDPYAYESLEGRLMYLAPRALDAARWGRFAKRVSGKLIENAHGLMDKAQPVSASDPVDLPADADDDGRARPPREEFGRNLKTILDRGTRIALHYTASSREVINSAGQFRRTFSDFDLGPNLEVEVHGDVDHTFTRQSAQATLVDRLTGLLRQCGP